MPGYTLYSASKFAMHGFQQGIRLEMPKNLKLTCLYPVATATNFFEVAADGKKVDKPFPVQKASTVAKAAVRGIEEFSHLWLIWEFSMLPKNRKDWSPTVRPPRLGGNERVRREALQM